MKDGKQNSHQRLVRFPNPLAAGSHAGTLFIYIWLPHGYCASDEIIRNKPSLADLPMFIRQF